MKRPSEARMLLDDACTELADVAEDLYCAAVLLERAGGADLGRVAADLARQAQSLRGRALLLRLLR